MNLLEGAEEVIRGVGNFPRAGLDGVCRSTGMHMRLIDACVEEYTDVIGTEGASAGAYSALPFGIQVLLQRSVFCQRPDDKQYVEQVMDTNIDYPLGRGLVVQPVDDTNVWIGDPMVQSVPLAGSTVANYVTAINAARKLWKSTVLVPAGAPILHIPPSLVPDLLGKIMWLDGPDLVSVWGDKVVVSDGYDLPSVPRIFLTGPYKVYLMPYQSDLHRATRLNDALVAVNTVALIDTEPCAIVRVGAYTP